jgi:hypothetical protein
VPLVAVSCLRVDSGSIEASSRLAVRFHPSAVSPCLGLLHELASHRFHFYSRNFTFIGTEAIIRLIHL